MRDDHGREMTDKRGGTQLPLEELGSVRGFRIVLIVFKFPNLWPGDAEQFLLTEAVPLVNIIRKSRRVLFLKSEIVLSCSVLVRSRNGKRDFGLNTGIRLYPWSDPSSPYSRIGRK